jgi:hypothetical protein
VSPAATVLLGSPGPLPLDAVENAFQLDGSGAAAVSAVPAFYVDADDGDAGLSGLRRVCPQLVVAKAPETGQGRLDEVPEAMNAVIDRFLSSLDQRAEA